MSLRYWGIINEVGWLKATWVMASWLAVVACGGGGSERDAALVDALVDADGRVADASSADAIEPIVPADDPVMPARGFFMGVIPWPATGIGQTITDAHIQVAAHAEFYSAHSEGAFYEKPQVYDDGYLAVIDSLIRGNGMFPIIAINFFGKVSEVGYLSTPEDMPDATLSDPAWRRLYKDSALALVVKARPRYISIGNEVNFWYHQFGTSPEDPNGFQHYVTLYEELYDEIKAISPETVVFCVFERERVRDNVVADMSVIELFDPSKLDLLALTSYPFAMPGVMRPDDIADDYYSSVLDHFDVDGATLNFTELGWPSLEVFGGEAAQADFVSQAANRLSRDQGVDLHLFSWLFLHDATTVDPLFTGLLTEDDVARQAYTTWQSLAAAGE